MAEFFPKMTFPERVQLLVHTHFEPGRITQAQKKIQAKIDSGHRPERHADYEARLAEYVARKAEIDMIWRAAPDEERAAAHERIAMHNAQGIFVGEKGGA